MIITIVILSFLVIFFFVLSVSWYRIAKKGEKFIIEITEKLNNLTNS